MTSVEIQRVLATCAPHRRLFLETAFTSGLRLNELRHLTLQHLDRKQCGLQLDAEWTKNRKAGFQPLARSLVERLYEFAVSGQPTEPIGFLSARTRKRWPLTRPYSMCRLPPQGPSTGISKKPG